LHCRLDYCVELPAIGHYPHIEVPQDVLTHHRTFIHDKKH
jgi:hypothetical protein